MLLHPKTRLRHDIATVYFNWDGSYTVAVAGHVLHDGERSEVRRGHAHRIGVGTEAWAHLTHGIAPAFTAHYDAEGLDPPEPSDLPLHLHPHVHGLPSVAGVAAPSVPADVRQRVHAHLGGAVQSAPPALDIVPPRPPRRALRPPLEGV